MVELDEIQALLERFHNKDRNALSRLVTHVSRGQHCDEIRNSLGETEHSTRVIALTGNSGVGKSSLVNQLIGEIRQRSQSVSVLACDPQSSITGGALLGDRVRMSNNSDDADVWIRSLATLSGRQAISEHLDLLATLLGAFGFDWVLIETVGAGQGDVAVRNVADVVCLLIQPDIGDELQWEKAGILEVADVVVVHKGDMPQSARTEAQVKELLNLPGCKQTPVIRVSSKDQTGIDELWDLILLQSQTERSNPSTLQQLIALAQEFIARTSVELSDDTDEIVRQWQSGHLTANEAICTLLQACMQNDEVKEKSGDSHQ